MNYGQLIKAREAIIASRHRFKLRYGHLPSRIITVKQRDLAFKHGNPREFAIAACAAIGEISEQECHEAIQDYVKEWNEAGL